MRDREAIMHSQSKKSTPAGASITYHYEHLGPCLSMKNMIIIFH